MNPSPSGALDFKCEKDEPFDPLVGPTGLPNSVVMSAVNVGFSFK